MALVDCIVYMDCRRDLCIYYTAAERGLYRDFLPALLLIMAQASLET